MATIATVSAAAERQIPSSMPGRRVAAASTKRPWPVNTVFFSVLSNVGARLPALDSVDRRVIRDVRHRVGKYFNGAGFPAPNPYWPSL